MTVDLVKESNVYSGHHLLQIRVSDQQGFSAIQNLSVTVCSCASDSSCHEKMVSKARIGSGGVWSIILAVLFLTAMLLMVFLMTCKTETKMIPLDEGSSHLISTNTELPGTDCMVPFSEDSQKTDYSKNTKVLNSNSDQWGTSQQMTVNGQQAVTQIPTLVSSDQMFHRSIQRSSSRRSYRDVRNYQRSSFRSTSYNGISIIRENISSLIHQRLLAFEARWEDPDEYKPHCYVLEGEFIADSDLDAISIAETDFHPEILNNLDYKFNNLATICQPPPLKT